MRNGRADKNKQTKGENTILEEMNGEYKIYVHINKVNGKIYIGQTKQTLEQRSSNGKAYKYCRHFWNAIQKYGWENFEHIVLIENLSLEMANIIEEYLIKKYDSTNRKIGYNLWFGGNNREVNEETRRIQREKKIGYNPWKIWDEETIESIKRKNSIAKMGEKNPMYGKQLSDKAKRLRKERRLHVLQYDLDGKFVKEWNSLEDASVEYDIAKANISKSCNEPTSICRGFLWRYKQGDVIPENIKSYKEMILELDNIRSAQFKPVYQYDLNGYYITSYEDFHEAEEVTGIKSYGINICCRGDLISYMGYRWSFEKHDKIQSVEELYNYDDKYKPIIQYDKNMIFIKIWKSISDASRELDINKHSIIKCCKGKQKTSGGYIFRYLNECDSVSKVVNKKNIIGKQVFQYNKNIELVGTYNTAQEASEINNLDASAISKCCRGELISCGGFFWSYIKDENKIKSDISRVRTYKKVYQYDKENNYIREFESSEIAENETGIKKINIQRCCQGRNITAGGYKWSYIKEEKLNQIIKSNIIEYTSWSSWKNKKVYQLDKDENIIQLFDSIAIAEQMTGTDHSSISKCCNGKMKSAGGFLWRYESDCKN